MKWRPVIWGLGLQFVFGLLILRTKFGFRAFKGLGDQVSAFLDYTIAGASFVFGKSYTDHFIAFKVIVCVLFVDSYSGNLILPYGKGQQNHIVKSGYRCKQTHWRSQDFSKGGSHWVKQYRHGFLGTEYCRLFALKKAYKGGGGVTGTPGPPSLRP